MDVERARVRIACLHTAGSNVAVFDAALAELGLGDVELVHEVRADLLDAAENAGGLTASIAGDTAAELTALSTTADAVLLTCSTLGPSVDLVGDSVPVPVVRVDAALAERAVAGGGRVVVLCTAPTTIEPTRALFDHHAAATGARVDVRLIDGAWPFLRAGDVDAYERLIASAAADALAGGADVVALAQASMASAASHCPGAVLASPAAGLAAVAIAVLDRRPGGDARHLERREPTPDHARL